MLRHQSKITYELPSMLSEKWRVYVLNIAVTLQFISNVAHLNQVIAFNIMISSSAESMLAVHFAEHLNIK